MEASLQFQPADERLDVLPRMVGSITLIESRELSFETTRAASPQAKLGDGLQTRRLRLQFRARLMGIDTRILEQSLHYLSVLS